MGWLRVELPAGVFRTAKGKRSEVTGGADVNRGGALLAISLAN